MLSSQYDIVSLNKVLKSKPQYGANESGIARNSLLAPRYIRITDINESGLLIDSIGVSASLVEDKYVLNDKDILFARSGATVGKSYLHHANRQDYKCFFAGYMIRFVINSKLALPEYVFLYSQLPTYANWVKYIQRAVGQPNINAEEFKSLLLPLPPIEDQRRIVDIFNAAYQQKQEKETQAKQLLAGIDDYLLSELGITLPEQDNSLNKRIFTTKFSKLTGSRFDPVVQFYVDCGESELLHNQLLKSIAVIEKGTSITKDQVISGIYPVIAGGQSSPYSHNKLNYNGNVITVSASGAYAGFVWYHNNPIFASDCCVIYSKDESVITTEFISEVLKFKQNDIYKLQQGAGQPHVYGSDLAKISMVIPSLEKQKEIAAKISKIRQEAKRLQEDGANILANAKIQVEQMILGN